MRLLTGWSRRGVGGALAGVAILRALGARPGLGGSTAGPRLHRIDIRRFAFTPRTLRIQAGDRVEWTNHDVAPHTATARDRSWHTGGLSKGASGAIAFPAPGRFPYYCAYHPNMKGEIVVLAAEGDAR